MPLNGSLDKLEILLLQQGLSVMKSVVYVDYDSLSFMLSLVEKSEGSGYLCRKNQRPFFHCFSSSEFPCRCNVMTPDVTHRQCCKSMS